MHTGGNKRVTKTFKTKFKKNRDEEFKNHDKQKKHHDKSFYRLLKQEREDYVV